MEQVLSLLKYFIAPSSIILALIIILYLNSWIFNKIRADKLSSNVIKNNITTFVTLTAIVIFILSLPIDKALKGQILSFLAIIVSAGIALSSTTILGNLIAGIMNNSMNRFRNGDLIKIGKLQGRVTKTNVFHVEIQLEDSNFTSIPNLYIATHPVKLTRKTDTVISTSVSLGYDVPRSTIEETLKEAALTTGLSDPYVYITDHGVFAVTYKIHGFLKDSSKYFSTNSLLNGHVMDSLHQKKIEIVSPTFMNQRDIKENIFIPRDRIGQEKNKTEKEGAPEDLVFDKAIKSEQIETKKDELKQLYKQKEDLKEKETPSKDKKEIKKIEEIKKTESSIQEIKEQHKEDNSKS